MNPDLHARIIYEARFEGEPRRCISPWDDLSDAEKAVWLRSAKAVAAAHAPLRSALADALQVLDYTAKAHPLITGQLALHAARHKGRTALEAPS